MKRKRNPGERRSSALRRCTGCFEMKEKNELIRVCRGKDDGEDKPSFSLDFTGKEPGRGAYICRNANCFELARKKRGFDRSFKQAVPDEIYEQLLKAVEEAVTD